MNPKTALEQGNTALGIELGSTRIKAVLSDEAGNVLASGSMLWENHLENGLWTYHMNEVFSGIQRAYMELKANVKAEYGVTLKKIGCIGISAMMHGYIPLDEENGLLTSFRTWRNTNTEKASAQLSELFSFNIPQRWSIAHLDQAILDKEEHVKNIRYLTTLAGYVHFLMSGQKVLGAGDAAGMFPLGESGSGWDERMLDLYEARIAESGYPWHLADILPAIKKAGEEAGKLLPEAALMLDPEGDLEAGISMCPPEGDAGTGMAATNSVRVHTGNLSAGTSVFAMSVLPAPVQKPHPEIDIVCTPDGLPVAMVHCNNCTNEINAWVRLLQSFARACGAQCSLNEAFTIFFETAMKGESDCSSVISYNYASGEPVTGFQEGRPMLVRDPDSDLSLENFARSQLYSALASLKTGMDILSREEGIRMEKICGHGGYFKTPQAGQQIAADALAVPVTVMKTADEGGAWGMSLLAAYCMHHQKHPQDSLADWLDTCVFANVPAVIAEPDPAGQDGFESYMKNYRKYLAAQRAAVEA